jgi:hypothetical protein
MAGNLRKPIGKNTAVPFSVEVEGQTYAGTLTPSGKPPALGMPNAFVVRIPGKPPVNISIYMGKWVMQAKDELVKAIGHFIEAHYK